MIYYFAWQQLLGHGLLFVPNFLHFLTTTDEGTTASLGHYHLFATHLAPVLSADYFNTHA
jgi:hypothetical protein